MMRNNPIFERKDISAGSRVCVGLSGGADSVALLCALNQANQLHEKSLGIGLSAVHIHHGLRGEEADRDVEFAQQLCSSLNIPLEIHRVDVSQHRDVTGETLEEAAKTLRYKVYRSILAEDRADDVLTAHTLNDQAETVVMKLLRGAWTEGLGGIHPILIPIQGSPKRILRPLLRTSRSQVIEFLTGIGQGWREDSSNTDFQHTRNRVRHQIMPVLRAENPSMDQTLANLAELAREEEGRWQRELSRLLPHLLLPGSPARGGGRSVSTGVSITSISVEIERLRVLDHPTQRRILRAAACKLQVAPGRAKEFRLTFDQTSQLLALCGFRSDATVSTRAGTVIQLGKYLTAKRTARELQLAVMPDTIPAKFGGINRDVKEHSSLR